MNVGLCSVRLTDAPVMAPTSSRPGVRAMRRLPVLMAAAAVTVAVGCSDSKTGIIDRVTDGNRVPTMTTRDVETLISDSGITRYRIVTPLWLVFDEADTPVWRFPETLHLEKFNDLMQRDATVDCDSAVYFKDRDLWRLDGNVRISNTIGERFLSEQLYWNSREHKVYTDSFIHVERHDRIIEGYGFVSNDRFTDYTVNRPSGIFPVSDFTGGDRSGATADTPAATRAPQPPAPRPADKLSPPPTPEPLNTASPARMTR
ncbi:MAG: LPS export ABC transporter periplasmic protein LptC [Pseudoflavonifractor sp.]|nr:LPS export ABC transporter periplasmic protein LptC [Pseudoflavonifractor sp.]